MPATLEVTGPQRGAHVTPPGGAESHIGPVSIRDTAQLPGSTPVGIEPRDRTG